MTPRRRPAITHRDQELLAFLALHRFVRTDHARTLLGVGARTVRARLARLLSGGLVTQDVVFAGQPECWQITRQGLAAIGSPLPAPRRDLATHAHDVGVAWLWLAARAGAFGPVRAVVSERELRSHHGPGRTPERPLAVRIPGSGPRGGDRLHYPDLLLETAAGERVALELELTGKSRARREQILEAYAGERSIDHVVYLVREPRIGREIAATARRLGLQDIVHVQRVELADPTLTPSGGARAARRAHARDAQAER